YKKAKQEKYRSRASYKLKQLNLKFKIIKKGHKVLDLGAAPGGWMQVLREFVGSEGKVVGVDLSDIRPFEHDNVAAIKGDFTTPEVIAQIKERIGKADVVVSDASPDISGVWDIDHICSVELSRSALALAKDILKPGGNFLIKVFQGAEVDDFYREVKAAFNYVKRTKPKASRDQSSEIYIVGKGLR
ncbi:methyltransferase domain-containing protein, partial [archaeon]|nr:methyltransferase domain-containing protein [archaeon]